MNKKKRSFFSPLAYFWHTTSVENLGKTKKIKYTLCKD
nr:MAG TPA: hypothetical protein [Inoviridae sp.]